MLRADITLVNLLIARSQAREVPQNLKTLYQQASAQGQCNDPLATGFYSWPSSSNGTIYSPDNSTFRGITAHQAGLG